jgi:DNA-binding NarL/FixJ family response regulator
MVDDNADEIFLTRRQVRRDGIVNNFVSEKKPEHLLETLTHLGTTGVDKSKIMILLDIKMLSASDDASDMFEAFDLGASGYIVKPFKADEFFAALTNLPQIKYQLIKHVQ